MKKVIFVSVILIIFSLCSCTTPVIQNESDELKASTWEGSSSNMSKISLKFVDENAYLDISSMGGAKTTIEGICIIEDDKITITDSKTKENYNFSFILMGDEITLNYDESDITLYKKE